MYSQTLCSSIAFLSTVSSVSSVSFHFRIIFVPFIFFRSIFVPFSLHFRFIFLFHLSFHNLVPFFVSFLGSVFWFAFVLIYPVPPVPKTGSGAAPDHHPPTVFLFLSCLKDFVHIVFRPEVHFISVSWFPSIFVVGFFLSFVVLSFLTSFPCS